MNVMHVVVLAVVLMMTRGAVSAERYLDSTFAYGYLDTVYGRNTTVRNQDQDLVMRIYTPENDTADRRPAVIWMHGGAFLVGQYLSADCVTLCKKLAGCGYVTATIEYRLGVSQTGDENENFKDALYRGTQDLKAAVRFVRAHAGRFGVDTSRIVIGGASAGGIATDAYLFWDQDEVGADRVSRLGSYDASGTPGTSDAIAGAVPWAGCVFDTALLNRVDVPVIAMHDTGDGSIPYTAGPAPRYPDITFYGNGYPAVAREAGGDFHLVTFYGGDHVPMPSGDTYGGWLDSVRVNVYERIVKPGQGVSGVGNPLLIPERASLSKPSGLFDVRGRYLPQNAPVPRGVYFVIDNNTMKKEVR